MCLKSENKYAALQRGDEDEEDGHEVESNPRDYTIGEVIRSAFHRKGLQAQDKNKKKQKKKGTPMLNKKRCNHDVVEVPAAEEPNEETMCQMCDGSVGAG